jgi:hypothetical protein
MWNLSICYWQHRSISLNPIHSHLNPFHLLKTHFSNQFFPSIPQSSKWSQSVRLFHQNYVCLCSAHCCYIVNLINRDYKKINRYLILVCCPLTLSISHGGIYIWLSNQEVCHLKWLTREITVEPGYNNTGSCNILSISINTPTNTQLILIYND